MTIAGSFVTRAREMRGLPPSSRATNSREAPRAKGTLHSGRATNSALFTGAARTAKSSPRSMTSTVAFSSVTSSSTLGCRAAKANSAGATRSAPMLTGAVTLTGPLSSRSSPSSVAAHSSCINGAARSSRAAPSGVTATERELRCKSRRPSPCSRAWMRRLRVLVGTRVRSAAREKLSSSATARNRFTSSRDIVPIMG